jgi:hypothetical protein
MERLPLFEKGTLVRARETFRKRVSKARKRFGVIPMSQLILHPDMPATKSIDDTGWTINWKARFDSLHEGMNWAKIARRPALRQNCPNSNYKIRFVKI